jgi:putative hydrolase of the HAD superfamily
MIQAVLFDFGNVVAFFDHLAACHRLAAYTDLAPSQLFALYYDSQLEDDFERGKLTTEEFVAECLRLGRLSCTPDQFLTAYCGIFEGNPEVAAVVPRLAGRYRLVIASNTNAAHSSHYRRQFADTIQHFDALVLSQEVNARKPERAFYAACQQAAGCPASACLFIDDLEANVLAAEEFGFQALLYRPDGRLEGWLRDKGVILKPG